MVLGFYGFLLGPILSMSHPCCPQVCRREGTQIAKLLLSSHGALNQLWLVGKKRPTGIAGGSWMIVSLIQGACGSSQDFTAPLDLSLSGDSFDGQSL